MSNREDADRISAFMSMSPAPQASDKDRQLSPATLEALKWAQCSDEEVAAFFGMDVDEFYEQLKKNPALEKMHRLAPISGKAALKRAQFINAMDGSEKMQQFLGQQHLGQSTKVEHAFTIEDLRKNNQAIAAELAKRSVGRYIEAEAYEVDEEEIEEDGE